MKRFILFLSFFFYLTFVTFAFEFENPIPYDSRMKTVIYEANGIVRLNFSKTMKSLIRFQKNEQIQLISIGDPSSWKLENIDGNLLFIKPLDSGVKTNMIIITNKRTYYLEIFSVEDNEDDDVAYVVKFYYPELNPDTPFKKKKVNIGTPADLNEKEETTEEVVTDNKIEAIDTKNKNLSSSLNFEYSYAGKDTDILPIKIFDNGAKTFLQFKNNNNIPEIYMVKKGKEYKIKNSLEGSYLVLNIVNEQFSIRQGIKLVCIFNKKLINLNYNNSKENK